MYMDDAIAATIKIMQAPIEQILDPRIILAAMSFTPTEIAAETSIFLNLRLPMNLTSSNS
jgi:hypothetical protein